MPHENPHPVIPAKTKNQKQKSRHSRAGGNPELSVRKLIGKNGFFRFYVLDSHFRGNDGILVSVRMDSS
ncbi:TPA: hypothetical protein ACODUR_001942, partial [Neisseria meningitidis]